MLNYDTNMNVGQLSTLYTISFSYPHIHPDCHGDFCIYFTLETQDTGTLVTDLALFIRDVGRKLIKRSVLRCSNRLEPGNPMHPSLQDLVYCWDGVATTYGVLQFSTQPVAAMNIQRGFHCMASICTPFCPTRRYEYFATGTFADTERETLPLVFNKMELAAQYVLRSVPSDLITHL